MNAPSAALELRGHQQRLAYRLEAAFRARRLPIGALRQRLLRLRAAELTSPERHVRELRQFLFWALGVTFALPIQPEFDADLLACERAVQAYHDALRADRPRRSSRGECATTRLWP